MTANKTGLAQDALQLYLYGNRAIKCRDRLFISTASFVGQYTMISWLSAFYYGDKIYRRGREACCCRWYLLYIALETDHR